MTKIGTKNHQNSLECIIIKNCALLVSSVAVRSVLKGRITNSMYFAKMLFIFRALCHVLSSPEAQVDFSYPCCTQEGS